MQDWYITILHVFSKWKLVFWHNESIEDVSWIKGGWIDINLEKTIEGTI